MNLPNIDLTPLRRAHALLSEALLFWNAQPEGTPLKPHLRSAVIQSFEFTYFASDASILLAALEANLAS